MPIKWICLVGLLFGTVSVAKSSSSPGGAVFTSSFLVRFKRSTANDVAHTLANKNGFLNVGPVSTYYSILDANIKNHLQYVLREEHMADEDWLEKKHEI
jgi:hypothetical protein